MAIDKVRRGFLWRGRKEAKGGHCLIAWDKVQRPKALGGLGISNLQILGWALRMRWSWLQKTDPDRPWTLFPIKLHKSVLTFFSMAVETIIRDGKQTLFWKDRSLQGRRLEDLALKIFALGALSVEVLMEFLDLSDILAGIDLQPDVLDSHIWRLSPSGQYSSKSAYENFFQDLGNVFGNHGHLTNEFAAPGHLSTLRPRDWDDCPPPDKLRVCMRFNLQNLAPLAEDESLDVWWNRESLKVHDLAQRGFNSLVILGAWTLWKHRNLCVFEGAAPSLARALLLAEEEAYLWVLAGARGISFLSALEPVG
ncbi:hypothetical protein U9M48_035473 [Paspalum notatum var. saurae]|uniref:Uncharacterized protein n=1 Tax=Paspalum notatum var. saurae TaxID=547442 RepID=A0AAQ3UB52_PASNO